ncbi:MAG: SAM-dependent methyltransferase, partial [Gammaproteobacteria bacterium]
PYVEEFSDRRVLNEKYDIVVAQDVIEHVEDPCALFSELSTQLAPGGILCIGTPRADAIDLLQFENFIHELHVPYHICILSESALLELGKINNLEIENVHRRLYLDTIVPFINWTFLRSYLRRIDNTLDASFEEPKIGMVARSPRLLFEGLFGYWLPVHTNMLVLFRKTEH